MAQATQATTTKISASPKYLKYSTHVDYHSETGRVTLQFWIHEVGTDGLGIMVHLALETAQELVADITKALSGEK